MSETSNIQIITFYQFKPFRQADLPGIRDALRHLMRRLDLKGTIILAAEGFNSTLCGVRGAISAFVPEAEAVLGTKLNIKSSFYDKPPFRRVEVKVKKEIVTLKRPIGVACLEGSQVKAQDWNDLINDPDVYLLDARNDYEFRTGTFCGAVNPQTSRFSDLPEFVAANMDPSRHKKVAMFCTGGIRCEKFAPYMKQLGFEQIYQLEGGILKYLEVIPPDSSMWTGECFVFDGRISVDKSLKKGCEPDRSVESKTAESQAGGELPSQT